jgi:transposase
LVADAESLQMIDRVEEIVFGRTGRRCRSRLWLPLPAYSPDLNPIEMAFSKLKALLRKHAARSFDALCDALKDICDMFDPIQCRNFFKAAGYGAD